MDEGARGAFFYRFFAWLSAPLRVSPKSGAGSAAQALRSTRQGKGVGLRARRGAGWAFGTGSRRQWRGGAAGPGAADSILRSAWRFNRAEPPPRFFGMNLRSSYFSPRPSDSVRSRPRRRADGRRSGFTLIEVMISTFVLAIVMAGVFAALKRGYDLVEMSRDETRVSQILQSELEDLRTKNWAALTALPAEETYLPQGRFSSVFGDKYSCHRRIADRAPGQKQIELTVQWTSLSGTTHSRQYLAWITQDGLFDYYYRSF